ncbi:MAG: glycosyltransferase [Selenomonadaceae bacterium]|nr:glycosyltransferase [Selenomonadaceae bacterium]
MNKNIPAVSVIIPMYNAEKYIGECLESILAQTFQDLEVRLVEDASTDNSCAVVESYIENRKGGGMDRIKLVRRKINSGNAAAPTNLGITISRGEYLFILDNDDLITSTALEELYPIAKKFDADVVHCEKFYQFKNTKDDGEVLGISAGQFVTEPTLISDDFAERVISLYKVQFVWNLWTKLIRRDFILENDLKMVSGISADAMFTCLLVCSAKRYVRVPNIINFYRAVENSLSSKKRTAPEKFHVWMHSLIKGFQLFDKFLSEREFFKNRPDMKYLALEVWVRECCNYLFDIFAQIPVWQLDELIRHELEDVQDKTALMAFIFGRMNIFNLQLNQQVLMLQQMNAQIQKQNETIQQQQALIQQLQSQIQK